MQSSIEVQQLLWAGSAIYPDLMANDWSRQALLINSAHKQYKPDLALVGTLDFSVSACLETHYYADHGTAA